jgi:hypothetical protein
VGAALGGAAAVHAAGVRGDVRRAVGAAAVDLLGDGVRALGRRRPHRAPPRRQRLARHQQPQGITLKSFEIRGPSRKNPFNFIL